MTRDRPTPGATPTRAIEQREREVTLTRRAALAPALLLPLGVGLLRCSRGPSCNDASGLSPDDAKVRAEIAAYVDHAPDATKRCLICIHFVPGPAGSCGSCKVVKGPINPEGTCKLFAPKQG